MHDPLDDADTRHLLALRSMLVDAVHRAHTASPLQRSTATVLLDGVSERALHLIAVERGLQIPRNNVDALLALVPADMAPAWRPPRLPDVCQLHRGVLGRGCASGEAVGPGTLDETPGHAAARVRRREAASGPATGVDRTGSRVGHRGRPDADGALPELCWVPCPPQE